MGKPVVNFSGEFVALGPLSKDYMDTYMHPVFSNTEDGDSVTLLVADCGIEARRSYNQWRIET